MSDQVIQRPAPISQTKATIALVLGVLSSVCLFAFFVAFVFGEDRLDGVVGYWLLLPVISFSAGAVAAFLGSLGWIDARRDPSAGGLLHSQIGAILGGVSVGIITLCVIFLLVALVILIGSWNEGVD